MHPAFIIWSKLAPWLRTISPGLLLLKFTQKSNIFVIEHLQYVRHCTRSRRYSSDAQPLPYSQAVGQTCKQIISTRCDYSKNSVKMYSSGSKAGRCGRSTKTSELRSYSIWSSELRPCVRSLWMELKDIQTREVCSVRFFSVALRTLITGLRIYSGSLPASFFLNAIVKANFLNESRINEVNIQTLKTLFSYLLKHSY